MSTLVGLTDCLEGDLLASWLLGCGLVVSLSTGCLMFLICLFLSLPQNCLSGHFLESLAVVVIQM